MKIDKQIKDAAYFRERNAQILALYNMNISRAEIGKKYGISVNQVLSIIKSQMQLTCQERQKRNKEAYELRKQGMSVAEISRKLGLNYEYTRRVIQKEHDENKFNGRKGSSIDEGLAMKSVAKLRKDGKKITAIPNNPTAFFLDGKAVGVGNLIKMAFPKDGMIFA